MPGVAVQTPNHVILTTARETATICVLLLANIAVVPAPLAGIDAVMYRLPADVTVLSMENTMETPQAAGAETCVVDGIIASAALRAADAVRLLLVAKTLLSLPLVPS